MCIIYHILVWCKFSDEGKPHQEFVKSLCSYKDIFELRNRVEAFALQYEMHASSYQRDCILGNYFSIIILSLLMLYLCLPSASFVVCLSWTKQHPYYTLYRGLLTSKFWVWSPLSQTVASFESLSGSFTFLFRNFLRLFIHSYRWFDDIVLILLWQTGRLTVLPAITTTRPMVCTIN